MIFPDPIRHPILHALTRRQLLRSAGMGAGMLALQNWSPSWAASPGRGLSELPVVTGDRIALEIAPRPGHSGRGGYGITVNGVCPAPLIRLREGQNVELAVTNRLAEDTSIHWHGLLVPFQFDGVPGLSFPGIRPGETFIYKFPIIQSGTYWYHSHSHMQEPQGLFGPLVIDPADPDPVAYDREHVLVLSDWSAMPPHTILRKLKQDPEYFNHQRQTLTSLLKGQDQPLSDRLEWAGMRMEPTDISDVTGATYRFLINGNDISDNWTGLFSRGQRVRLRIINAASMTIFNFRIPGLRMTVVQADGQNVRPVTVDEFQIAVAETYDVIVEPDDSRAYTIVAEAIDRSGMARGTLAPRPGMSAPIPPLRKRPVLGMVDMGMDMPATPKTAKGAHAMPEMDMSMRNPANAPGVPLNPGVASLAPMAKSRINEPGLGLADAGHRVLNYGDLAALDRNPDTRRPSRTMTIHLTANMERYIWAFDGVKYSDAKHPIAFRRNERVRVVLVNDTMMTHPIHLHGHFFELVSGKGAHAPRKHTVSVMPGGKATFDVTMDAPGDWAFHCHLSFHMDSGMFQVVTVRPMEEPA